MGCRTSGRSATAANRRAVGGGWSRVRAVAARGHDLGPRGWLTTDELYYTNCISAILFRMLSDFWTSGPRFPRNSPSPWGCQSNHPSHRTAASRIISRPTRDVRFSMRGAATAGPKAGGWRCVVGDELPCGVPAKETLRRLEVRSNLLKLIHPDAVLRISVLLAVDTTSASTGRVRELALRRVFHWWSLAEVSANRASAADRCGR